MFLLINGDPNGPEPYYRFGTPGKQAVHLVKTPERKGKGASPSKAGDTSLSVGSVCFWGLGEAV